jgi:hypothetical protein
VQVEARGIPAVVLGTDAFLLSLARAQATRLGLPHLAVALVGHPIGGIDPAIVRGKAETIVDEVHAALTHDPAPPARLPRTAGAAVAEAPEDLMVIVAGGPGKHSAVVPTFGATRSVTVAIEE